MTANRKSIRSARQKPLRSALVKPPRKLRESVTRKEQTTSAEPKLSEKLQEAKAEGRLVTLSGTTGKSITKPIEMLFDWKRTAIVGVGQEFEPTEYHVDLPSGVLLNRGEVFKIRMVLPKPASEYPPEAYLDVHLRFSSVHWWLPLDGSSGNGFDKAQWVAERKGVSSSDSGPATPAEEKPKTATKQDTKVGERLRRAELEERVVTVRGRNDRSKPLILDFNSNQTKLYGAPEGKEEFRLYMVTRRTNLNPDESFVAKLELDCRVDELDELAYVKLFLTSGVNWMLSVRGLSQAELKRRLEEREVARTAEARAIALKELEESAEVKKSKRWKSRRD